MAKKKEIKVPNKKSLNLYQPDYKNDPKTTLIIGLAIIVLVTAILSKFLIIDKLNEMNAYSMETEQKNEELTALQQRYAGYADLKEDYYRYSDTYTKGEQKLVDRITVTRILSDTTEDLAEITSTSISDNLVNIKVVTEDLEKLAEFRTRLENTGLVTDVVVYSAARSTGDVVSSLAFKCLVK